MIACFSLLSILGLGRFPRPPPGKGRGSLGKFHRSEKSVVALITGEQIERGLTAHQQKSPQQ